MRITEPFLQSLNFKTNNCNINKNYYHLYYTRDNIETVYDPIDDIWETKYKNSNTLLMCKTNNQNIFKLFVILCENIDKNEYTKDI